VVEEYASCERMNPDGSFSYCYDGGSTENYCQQYALGHACANQGECKNGLCSSKGSCVATQVGQACKYDLGCSGSQICRNNSCTVPTPGSLQPLDACKVNASCVTNRCVTSIMDSGIHQIRDTSPV
ncbi:hypothetical protein OC846_006710, partial [Tilletia horrida]